LLGESTMPFLRKVVEIIVPEKSEEEVKRASTVSRGAAKKQTLGSIFKASLVSLMLVMRETDVHYIRCIKPNQSKKAFAFEPQLVLQQLRACGVLETIRISCAGYPSRWTFAEFADRYYLLTHSREWTQERDPRVLAELIVKGEMGEDKYQMGLTKVFFRAGQLAFLERQRSDRLSYCVVLIQKNIKRHIREKQFRIKKTSAVKIQSVVRGWIARERYHKQRRERGALTIQRIGRGYIARKAYSKDIAAIVTVQRGQICAEI
jgi:myosin-5